MKYYTYNKNGTKIYLDVTTEYRTRKEINHDVILSIYGEQIEVDPNYVFAEIEYELLIPYLATVLGAVLSYYSIVGFILGVALGSGIGMIVNYKEKINIKKFNNSRYE